MAGYARISAIADPQVKTALIQALDKIAGLEVRLATLEAVALRNDQPIDANGQRVRHVANPETLTDAVNIQYLRSFSQANLEAFKGNLGVDGSIDTTASQIITVKNGLITEIA